jgi:hypothetical protein
MSYTFTRDAGKKGGDVQGSTRAVFGVVVADASSGVITPGALGIKRIIGGAITPKSVTTGGFKTVFNAATASASSNGYVNIASCASGDEFYVYVNGV